MIIVFSDNNNENIKLERRFSSNEELNELLNQNSNLNYKTATIYKIEDDPLKLIPMVNLYLSNRGIWTVDYRR